MNIRLTIVEAENILKKANIIPEGYKLTYISRLTNGWQLYVQEDDNRQT